MSRMLSRRAVLRGAGAAVALPLLDAMSPAFGAAAPAAGPKRMAFVFVPNGINMADWTPRAEGASFELPRTLEPLNPVKSDLLVLTGLTHDKARANGDGPGDHARSGASFLTGVQPRKTAGANIRAGISVDQVAAARIGRATRLPSLEIGCDRGLNSGNCDSGYSCAYSANISWKSESMPMAKEVSPRAVFDRLFSAGADPKRDRQRRSILDYVAEDTAKVGRELGAGDRRKLDEYLQGVREIEVRIERAEKESRTTPTAAPKMDLPVGVPRDYAEHMRLLFDLLVLAFQTDSTRIATFMLANEGSNRPYPFIGVSEGHHDLSHHGNDTAKKEKIAKINRFHMEQHARFLSRLKAIKEGSGTLLDNCMIVYGSAISDGNRHNHDDLPVVLAGGGAGTIKTGRHIRYPQNTPMNNLFLSMLERMGVPTDTLGDSTGRLNNLS